MFKHGDSFIRGLPAAALLCALPLCAAAEDAQALWQRAMTDAVFAQEAEIEPLLCLTRDEPRVIWDDAFERVLLLTWHDYPSDCAPGTALGADCGEIWATSLGEMQAWFAGAGEVPDWTLRFAQLLGVHADEGYTRFTAFWARPGDVIRPAYESRTDRQMHCDYGRLPPGEYKDWFDDNIVFSYFESDYPWTRLGYTYDWSGGASEYGLSEFLLTDGDRTEIAFTLSTADFVAYLSRGGWNAARGQ